MKKNLDQPDIMKRKLLVLLGSLPFVAGCATAKSATVDQATEDPLRRKFRGIDGIVLRLDAATPKEYVTMTTEAGWQISGAALLSLENVKDQTYTGDGLHIPRTIRATWRKGDIHHGRYGWEGGTIIGDYTVPVAERIPDEVLDYIRKNGGALRLKIRLKDDGILIGWDIEERVPNKYDMPRNYLRYSLPGGDFREAQIRGGKVIDPGWQN